MCHRLAHPVIRFHHLLIFSTSFKYDRRILIRISQFAVTDGSDRVRRKRRINNPPVQTYLIVIN